MPQWEYMDTHYVNHSVLAGLGRDGWEMCAAVRIGEGLYAETRYHFKRPLLAADSYREPAK